MKCPLVLYIIFIGFPVNNRRFYLFFLFSGVIMQLQSHFR